MTKHFDNFGDLALEFLTLGPSLVANLHTGMDNLGGALVRRMEAKIGKYQGASGGFPAWAPLAQSTEDRKQAAGYRLDAPLLATGEMGESFKHTVGVNDLVAGSTDPKMVFHEFGTAKMPPRPVVGPVGFESKELIQATMGSALVSAFVGADVARGLASAEVHESLGYRFQIRR